MVKILVELMVRAFGWVIAGVWFLFRAVLIAWAALAIYYSDLPWSGSAWAWRLPLRYSRSWTLWLSRFGWRLQAAFAVLYLVVVAWWVVHPSPRTIAPGGRKSR